MPARRSPLRTPLAYLAAGFLPQLSVNVPQVSFTEAGVEGQTVTVPWIAQYLVGLYSYGLTVGGVLAAVMMMWGGFQWLMGKPAEGKTKLVNAAAGLVVLLSAYIILTVVNPELVSLKGLQIERVQKDPLVISYKSEDAANGRPGKNVQLDDKYKKPVDLIIPPASSCSSASVSQEIRDAAIRSQAKTGVPAAVLIGQWSIESDNGRSCLGPAGKKYNCWGLKCYSGGQYQGNETPVSSGTKPTCPSDCQLAKTKETVKGVSDTYYACFQIFETFDAALSNHAKAVMRGNWQEYAKNPVGFAKFVQAVGYATATDYSEAVITRMKKNCLLSPEAAAVK